MFKSLIVSFVSLVSLVNAADPYNFIYTTDSKEKLVYVTIDNSLNSLDKSALNCLVVSNPDDASKILSSTSDPIKQIDAEAFNTLLSSCDAVQPKLKAKIGAKNWFKNSFSALVDVLDDLLIAPGTKWCGKGNRAKNFTDLGDLVETDKCCRTHDHCPMVLHKGETAFGLTNTQGFTSCHCDCDYVLKECLHSVSEKEPEANLIGAMFFNILKSKCFKAVEPEAVSKDQCIEQPGTINKRCVTAAAAETNAIEPVYEFTTAGGYDK